MSDDSKRSAGLFLMPLAAFVVIVAGMRAAQPLVTPFLLAAFLGVISAPPLFWLQRKRVPSALALLLVVAGVIIIIVALGALLGTSVEGFSKALPHYQARLDEQVAVLLRWLENRGVHVSEQRVFEYLDPRAAMNFAAGMLRGFGSVLTNAFLIVLTVIFILLEAASFPAKLRAISGGSGNSLARFEKVTENVQHYMALKTLTSLLTGVTITIALTIIGVDFPLLWGLVAFILNFVPNIGSIIAAVPAVLLAFIQLGLGAVLWTGAAYLVVNMLVGQVLEPRLMGRGLGLSTLVVFISLVFWGWVLGPVGMFLSVPLTMTVKIALDSDERTRWLAILLGSEASVKTVLAASSASSPAEPPGGEPPTPPPVAGG
ncbi:MAG: AI-2E family transporter [Acidiferrobacterales bacterium]